MKRPSNDYFSGRPVRGSSPAASLAADMSQNFHIDRRYVFIPRVDECISLQVFQSPRPETPRRSLFTSKLFQPPIDRGT